MEGERRTEREGKIERGREREGEEDGWNNIYYRERNNGAVKERWML